MARKYFTEETVPPWIAEFPDLSFEGGLLICKVCNTTIFTIQKHIIRKHISSHNSAIGGDKFVINQYPSLHKQIERDKPVVKEEPNDLEEKPASSNTNEAILSRDQLFNLELLKFMVGCNIPWAQLDNPAFREFIENCSQGRYFQAKLCKSSAIRKDYLPRVAQDIISDIRQTLRGKYFWLSLSESTAASGLQMINILVGEMNEFHSTKVYLVAAKVLETVNAQSVVNLVEDNLKVLWGDDLNKDKFLLFITNSNDYMQETGRILQKEYDFVHIACLADALHSIAETVKNCYPHVDTLMSSVQKAFQKVPDFAKMCNEMFPNTPPLPEITLTKCGTWIEASIYYYTYLEQLKQVIHRFDQNQTLEVAIAREILMDPNVRKSLQEVHYLFSRIPLAIQQLQHYPRPENFSIIDQITVIDNLRHQISLSECSPLVKQRMEAVLQSNPGFSKLSVIVNLLNGKVVDLSAPEYRTCLNKYSQFRYAPITALDVERTFSVCKQVFSDKQRHLSPPHLEEILIIYVYYYNTNIRK